MPLQKHNIVYKLVFRQILFHRQLLAPNGQLLREGDTLKQTQLANTLEQIGEQGIGYFYNSSFTERMVQELQNDWDSIITVEDFQNYSSVERDVVNATYKGLKMLSMPPPSAGGPVLGLILNILDGYYACMKKFLDAPKA